MTIKKFISVIIPSYNETENLKRGVLGQVRDYLKKQDYPWEVIVSEDESPDLESRRLAREFCEKNENFIFLQNAHGGKAKAVWQGIQRASGELVLFTDMDQSTPISELAKLLPKFQEGFDVVIGSRGLERKNFSPVRKLASAVFRRFRNLVLGSNIVDTQAGFKAMKSSVAREIFPQLSAVNFIGTRRGWTVGAFDVELLVIAALRGFKIAEVPIRWEDRDESTAKAKERRQGKFLRESVDMAREVLRVKYNMLAGRYQK